MNDADELRARERNDAIAAVGVRLKLGQIDVPEMVGEINLLFAKWYSDEEVGKMMELPRGLAGHIAGSAVRG